MNDFVAIFKTEETIERKMSVKKEAYMQLTDLLGIILNDSKDGQEIVIVIFGIENNISCFITRFSKKILEKVIRTTTKVLGQKSVNFINM